MTTTSNHPTDMVPVPLPGMPPMPVLEPRYAILLAQRSELAGRAPAFDVYRDIYLPTYKQVSDDVDDCIGLVCAFVEYVTGEPCETSARKRVAMAVRQYGLAALYGLDQALSHVDDVTDERKLMTYAIAVARNRVAQHREGATP